MSGQLAKMVREKHPGAYDDMDDVALEAAIVAKYPGVYDDLVTAKPAAPAQAAPVHPHARTAQAVADVAKGAWGAVAAIPGALYDMAKDVAPFDEQGQPKMPLGNTVRGMGQAQGQLGVESADAFRKGDYLTAATKGAKYLLPVLGPMMDASGQKMEQGNIAEGVGELGANAYMMATGLKPRPKPGVTVKKPIMSGPTNPKEAAAVEFARQQGVPLDLATATGSQPARNWQKTVGNTFAGHNTAANMRASQDAALTRVGNDLATQAGPKAANTVSAGESVRAAVTQRINNLAAKQDTAYGRLKQFEADATPDMVAPRGVTRGPDGTSAGSFQDMQLAVDLRPNKPELMKIYRELADENAIVPFHAESGKAKALLALGKIVNGPDFAPLSVVDGALGELKAMARGADMPALRNQGQGVAAFAVKKLDAQLRARAAQAGPEVLKALEEGRTATIQKYEAADVLDMLSGEPGQVFRQLTQGKDVGLNRLRAVEKIAPEQMPNISRAFLEDLMQTATQEGKFGHADKLWADWNRLGTETKAKLFPKKGQIEALDNFFLLGKKINENPNPSGTGTMPKLNFAEFFAAIPATVAAKIMLTPAGVKALTTSRMVARNPSRASQALAFTQFTKAAQSAGVPLEAIPAFAGEHETSTPSGRRK